MATSVENIAINEFDLPVRRPAISWGAIVAGLFLVVAGEWLLFLLGTALGAGVADATDARALNEGFGYVVGSVNGGARAGALLSPQIESAIKDRAAQAIASTAAADGSAAISVNEARRALDRIDMGTMQRVAAELIRGDQQRARGILTTESGLSEREVNGLIAGITNNTNELTQDVQADMQRRLEQLSTYTQAVLWTLFVAALVALIVALIGGSMGAADERLLGFGTSASAQRVRPTA